MAAAALGEGLGGRRARGFARVPLEPGALVPSPTGPSFARGDEVRGAVRRALEGLGGGRVTLVLPDGLARIALFDLPRGAEPRDYVRFRLAASLPWPASETIVDVPARGPRPGGRRRPASLDRRRVRGGRGRDGARDRARPPRAPPGARGPRARGRARRRPRGAGGRRPVPRHVSRGGARGPAQPAPRPLERRGLAAAGGAGARGGARRQRDRPGPARRLRRRRRAIAARDRCRAFRRGLEGPGEWDDAVEAAWLGGLLS